jgi:hypothetical protein
MSGPATPGAGGAAPGRDDPHGGQPVAHGRRAARRRARGGGDGARPRRVAREHLTLAPALAARASRSSRRRAAGGQWYPYGFMSPIERNEPGITSGMRAVARALDQAAAAGVPPERTLLSASRRARVWRRSSRPATRGATAGSRC